MIATVEEYARSLIESGLLSADELASFRNGLTRHPKDVQELARELVRQELLTKYQAQQVYAGKGKRLVMGHYVVLEHIAAGGMGQVYKARHRRMGRVVALKLLPAAATKSLQAVKRFQREVQAAARLVHPNIVMAFDADQVGEAHFLVMEFVDARDLRSLIKAQGPFPVEQAVDCIVQAARGLEYAHEQGVVHRDIKPANLLLDQEGVLKILDMGLAHIDDDEGGSDSGQHGLTQSGMLLGTVDYMSPEQAEDTRKADARSDIYSLGCTLYCLLAGQAPYSGETTAKKLLAHRNDPPPSLRGVREELSPDLDQIMQRMMAKRPEDRYQSMSEVLADLKSGSVSGAPARPNLSRADSHDDNLSKFLLEMAASGPTTFSGASPTVQGSTVVRRGSRRSWLWIVLAMAGLAMIGIVATMLMLR